MSNPDRVGRRQMKIITETSHEIGILHFNIGKLNCVAENNCDNIETFSREQNMKISSLMDSNNSHKLMSIIYKKLFLMIFAQSRMDEGLLI